MAILNEERERKAEKLQVRNQEAQKGRKALDPGD
jgi:hypothetical protein